MTTGSDADRSLSADERQWLAQVRAATGLADLRSVTGADSEHQAYFVAKQRWRDLRARELGTAEPSNGLPGDCVTIEDQRYCVHGITHANTAAERDYLRDHVSRFLEAGAAVYCEQGIRSMYFADFPEVYDMDDYHWAMDRCRALDHDSRVEGLGGEFHGIQEEVNQIASQLRDATFSLIEAGREVYGKTYARALGDVAGYFLTSHEDIATGRDFTSFRLSRTAARDPEKLLELQTYYKTAFLPQPIEREWLKRHDRELEILTHARNERMAAFVRSQATERPVVHLIVGAAHQPGVTYYLDRYRDGQAPVEGFETVE